MQSFWQDLAIARRSLSHHKGVWILAVIALASGLGVNSTVYSLLRSLFDRPLSTVNKPGLLMMKAVNHRQGPDRRRITPAEFRFWAEEASCFETVAAWRMDQVALASDAGSERVGSTEISAGFLSILKPQLLLGSWFDSDHFTNRSARVVVISHSLWQRKFASDRALAGKTIFGPSHHRERNR